MEVTESAIIADRNQTSLVLQRLKNAGINIALDDFGTGYSSLSYLNSLPLTRSKSIVPLSRISPMTDVL